MRALDFLAVATCATLASSAMGVTITYEKTLNFSPHPTFGRMVGAVPAAGGGFYFIDNASDNIGIIQTPSTATGGTNNSGDTVEIAAVGYNSGFSSVAITYDGSNLYGGGANGASETQYWKIAGQPTGTATVDGLTEPAGALNGLDAIGTGKFVAPSATGAALNFLTESGGTVTVDGTVNITGAPTNSRFVRAVADLANNRIFVNSVAQNLTGQVYILTSDGTPAGTSFNAGSNPYIAGVASSYAGPTFSGGSFYSGMDYSAAHNLLVISVNRGTTGADGWAVYDVSGATPSLLTFIDGTDTPDGAIADNGAYGVVFYQEGGDDYLALSRNGRVHIYKVEADSAVSDWSVY